MQYLKQEIRDRILSAAIDEFKIHGFAEASIRNIAENADISLGNIYRYFTNKEALFLAIVNPVLDKAINKIGEIFEGNFDISKDMPTEIIEFTKNYNDEYLIISKGTAQHYKEFIDKMVYAFAIKLEKYINDRYSAAKKNIHTISFPIAVSSSFINGLRILMHTDDTDEQKVINMKQFIQFFFADIDKRIFLL